MCVCVQFMSVCSAVRPSILPGYQLHHVFLSLLALRGHLGIGTRDPHTFEVFSRHFCSRDDASGPVKNVIITLIDIVQHQTEKDAMRM